ncbi:MAG: helix-turn-helix domain-containing protein [Patescibacteria group bacterium]|jgi:predicted site-specific integrase-resolvase|nr:helix-turn-helix domain-containing protein [Patescibacteria group bacterium]
MQEIKPNNVYTTEETRDFLKISKSTIKRWLKKGLIRANKVGGQYRILGAEILRLISPVLEKEAQKIYREIKEKTKKRIKDW